MCVIICVSATYFSIVDISKEVYEEANKSKRLIPYKCVECKVTVPDGAPFDPSNLPSDTNTSFCSCEHPLLDMSESDEQTPSSPSTSAVSCAR